jgi:hypothetical protein
MVLLYFRVQYTKIIVTFIHIGSKKETAPFRIIFRQAAVSCGGNLSSVPFRFRLY